MKMGYSIDSIDDDCYDGTLCLVNKLDIRDENKLYVIESQISVAKISLLQKNPIEGDFDFEHYKSIHKFIFEDLYDWAGEIRTVDLSKKETNFVKASNIKSVASEYFKRLRNKDFFRNLSIDDFVDEMTDFYCVTNILHPFREGNGRTQRVFLSQLAAFAGYELDFTKVDVDLMMIATIKAAQGVDDYLRNIMREIISPVIP